MSRIPSLAIALLVLAAMPYRAMAEAGDPARGARMYRACAACHSLEADRNMTGPSLAELWNRRAGGLPSFPRYSPALKSSGIVWNDETLDEWLKDPTHFIPGNTMTYPGIREPQPRADLLAFLREATGPGRAAAAQPPQDQAGQGGMGGIMGSGTAPNLKTLAPQQRVRSIGLCGDTYRVTTADGNTRDFWERNLRFKTDSSGEGPEKGAPAILRAGMMGDRAAVIFAAPEEIGGFISHRC